jgi:DNA primase small subunit
MFIRHILPASGHGILAKEEHWKELLATLPEAALPVKEHLERKWKNASSSTPAEKWAELKKHLEIFIGKHKSNTGKAAKNISTTDRNKIESWPMEVVFRYTYPRLDINVSKMQNHLLKSPFCVHPKTGRVCVPIQVENVDKFDPFAVPTLPQLQAELDAYEAKTTDDGGSGKITHDWQKTSLKDYFEPFEKDFLEPLLKDLRRKQREEKEQQAAVIGDF